MPPCFFTFLYQYGNSNGDFSHSEIRAGVHALSSSCQKGRTYIFRYRCLIVETIHSRDRGWEADFHSVKSPDVGFFSTGGSEP
jgi:hypothetical protein